MREPVAIVGLACRYPDADTPALLWDNVLAQRRAFRRIPAERLRVADYAPERVGPADSTYVRDAALLEGYAFDRVRFRVGATSWRAADMTHWLALDVAADALADAGLDHDSAARRRATGVLLGNSLTGEFSRASQLRLRWPYVQRSLGGVLDRRGMGADERRALMADFEEVFKAPFPVPDEETLAGGLSNTIAGRICNHFGFNGGGYTVDGACASSLLSVANACSALAAGDLDVVLAGGVDLSLDPFELIGFARTGALAQHGMRIYDARPTGFLPGEGCGFAVLMRLADAQAEGRRIRAVIRGWGISSDGKGGLTRPDADGQRLALERAYARAGIGIERVALFEGHGTGTAVGDATELATLSRARRDAGASGLPAAIGSVKANIGHTKAASGLAGLVKACLALEAGLLPPTTGCETPHAALRDPAATLRTLARTEAWPDRADAVAGVSSMGFGGINAHLVLAAADAPRARPLAARERRLDATAQDQELFVLDAADVSAAAARARELAAFAASLAYADLADLGAHLANGLRGLPVRIAIVAAQPRELAERLARAADLVEVLQAPAVSLLDGLCLGVGMVRPRIGFLFPGQGSPVRSDGGAWRRRFADVDAHYRQAALAAGDDSDTAVAQPGIVTASLAALHVLDRLGLDADIALGHSLGEISALAWAGAFDDSAALRIARARGAAMQAQGSGGAMASVSLGAAATAARIEGTALEIAAFNAPEQTVVSGAAADVDALLDRLRAQHIPCARLPVSQAFHSRRIAAAEVALSAALAAERLTAPLRPVASTVTGALLTGETDVSALLCRQVTAPVRFTDALHAAGNTPDLTPDLWIELGAGSVVSRLARASTSVTTLSVDACGDSFAGLLSAVGAAWAAGATPDLPALFADRAIRPFSYRPRQFLANPCERAAEPAPVAAALPSATLAAAPAAPIAAEITAAAGSVDVAQVLACLSQQLAVRTELPASAISADSRLLSDLHLNSIAVGQLVVETTRALGLPAPASPTDFADARVSEVAEALARLADGAPMPEPFPPGVGPWLREFRIDWQPVAAPPRRGSSESATWRIIGQAAHALAGPLRHELEASGAGSGIALILDGAAADEAMFEALLDAARLLSADSALNVLIVHDGTDCTGFARTLHLERGSTVAVVEASLTDPATAARAAAEMANAVGFVEVRWRAAVRELPVWRVIDDTGDRDDRALPRAGEVLLVTGGGRGIAAECALEIARRTGCKLALVGRSEYAANTELARNLQRCDAAGLTWRYYTADVADAGAVATVVAAARRELGVISAVLHGAGVNTPCLAAHLDVAALQRTLAPKGPGLSHILRVLDAGSLRLVVTFGSIIARTGLAGEADYALANERLARELRVFAAAHPQCRCRNLEWSVWSGVGMGERLDRVDGLLRQGITPVPPEAGMERCIALCRRADLPVNVVVAGRFGNPPTVRLAPAPLPFLRFLERVRLQVPGVELIVEADLCSNSDPFLADHAYAGERLFPAVLGLEAMLQTAFALDLRDEACRPRFERVRFDRPVVVPEDHTVTIRIAALRRSPGLVDVVLRSASTGFQVDHFRATCRFDAEIPVAEPAAESDGVTLLDPATEVYGPLLPHLGRFRRLLGYRRLSAEHCVADIAGDASPCWFGRALPGELLLGDPGARDAAIHALQACIPHQTVLPVAIARLDIDGVAASSAWRVTASERSRDATSLVYDLVIADAEGRTRERWDGLVLRIVRDCPPPVRWPLALLGPYVQRRVAVLLSASPLHVAVDRGERQGTEQETSRLLAAAIGVPVALHHRPDGKPLASHGYHVSLAYSGGVALAVAGRRAVGCDLERVGERLSTHWRDLLGMERWRLAEQLADEHAEDVDSAATRVWTSLESFKKAGLPVDAPVTLGDRSADSWTLLRCGRFAAATMVAAAQGVDEPLALAVALEETAEPAA